MASAASMASNEEDGPEEAMNLVVAKSPVVDGEAIDEEEAEALEVTKLLSGGIMETHFGDLMTHGKQDPRSCYQPLLLAAP